MSSIDELRSKIAVVNSTSARLNEQRNKNLGMRETLERQRDTAVKAYMEKYGVDLTKVSMDAEFNRLVQEKSAEVAILEQAITSINAGDYASAKSVLGIDGKSESVAVEQSVQSAPTVQPIAQPVAEPTQPVEFVVTAFTPPVSAPAMMEMSQPKPVDNLVGMGDILKVPEPVMPTAPTSPIAPAPVAQPTVPAGLQIGSGLDLSGLNTPPVITNKATDFSGILNGEPFNPASL